MTKDLPIDERTKEMLDREFGEKRANEMRDKMQEFMDSLNWYAIGDDRVRDLDLAVPVASSHLTLTFGRDD